MLYLGAGDAAQVVGINKQVLEGVVQDGSSSTFAVLNKLLMLDYWDGYT